MDSDNNIHPRLEFRMLLTRVHVMRVAAQAMFSVPVPGQVMVFRTLTGAVHSVLSLDTVQ
ncbi:hypothetical protein KP79_PYT05030 [Mizuhopecten yessoensis]|uniref:Uncharacterized protein n=1 Tax=Mizuhopecten yessoensis TaxID=6573 RepID=A0A210QJ47_MIZYE|nr:hypothetical protein KP79_PYT05030 [Mizuhopecten yessoensis]